MITGHTTVAEGIRFALFLDAPATMKMRIKNKIGIAIFAVGDDAVLVEKILSEMAAVKRNEAERKEDHGEAEKAKAKGKGKRAGAGDRGSA